jgi:hypothetical protein
VILDLTRPLILNGIDHLAERPDLADRALILNLPRIEDTERKEEKDLYAAYELERPFILGELLAAISAALANQPEVRLVRRPRMADFATFATAAEVPLGFQPGAFLDAYSGNRSEAVQETLESDAVGAAILAVISDEKHEGQWRGISKELLKQLEQIVEEGVKKTSAWPKTPRGLSSRLRRLATFLRESGVEITFPDKRATAGARVLTISRMASHSTAPTAATVTGQYVSPSNQPVMETSGGRSVGAADEPHDRDQPPPEPLSAIPLRGKGFSELVAEEAVLCTSDLVGLETEDRMAEVEL